MAFNCCAIVPTYDNPETVAAVVEQVLQFVSHVIVVDDGSGEEARAVARELAKDERVEILFRSKNGGKGAAVMTGLMAAEAGGFTHALQIDADGQHDPADIPKFLAAAVANEPALILGQPLFDDSAPKSRLWGRRISVFWCMVETWSTKVGDPLCGYRVYPVSATIAAAASGRTMDFDPEIAVRLAWAGVPIVHLATRVRYIEGGVSHYRVVQDNLLISWMHTRMCTLGLLRLVTLPFRRRLPK